MGHKELNDSHKQNSNLNIKHLKIKLQWLDKACKKENKVKLGYNEQLGTDQICS